MKARKKRRVTHLKTIKIMRKWNKTRWIKHKPRLKTKAMMESKVLNWQILPNNRMRYLPLYGNSLSLSYSTFPFWYTSPVTVFIILSPHPSLLLVLVRFHLLILRSPVVFLTHLLITYSLTFLAFSSLIVCVARDPGPVTDLAVPERSRDGDEVSLAQALMSGEDDDSGSLWCRKCSVRSKKIFNILMTGNLKMSNPQRPQSQNVHIIVVNVVGAFSS